VGQVARSGQPDPGRKKGGKRQPRLEAPPGVWVGGVQKVCDAAGKLVRVKARALFGWRKDIGQEINPGHVARRHGTLGGQQARLARRTRHGSRGEGRQQLSLWLWLDLYNWTRGHGAQGGRMPAMALGLTERV
jgi:hypothetical protein